MATAKEVIAGAHFASTYSGDGTSITNIARGNVSAGTANFVVINNGTGILTDEAQLAGSRGGTGIDTTATTGLAKVATGVWSVATLVDADVNAAAAIGRTKIASGTADHVLINTGAGVMSSEAQLAGSRGGTGIDTTAATGLAKVAGGTWGISTLVNADVNAAAAIDRTKIASGSANHVIINTAGGVLTSEAQLAVSRGGTGADFSGIGAGPFALVGSSGVITASTLMTAAATADTVALRDGGGGAAFTSVTTPSVTSTGTLSVAPTGALTLGGTSINTGDKVINSVPSAIAGGLREQYIISFASVTNTYVTAWSYTTATDTSYHFNVAIVGGNVTTGTDAASYKFHFRVLNVGGVVSKSVDLQKSSSEIGMGTADARSGISGTDAIIEIRGIAGSTINWTIRADVISQAF